MEAQLPLEVELPMNTMHDFLAAKEILDTALSAAKDKKIKKITKIAIELGNKEYEHGSTWFDRTHHKSLTTGGGHKHFETINAENLEFNLKLIAKDTIAGKAIFIIKKSDISDILVKEIEGE